MRAAFLTAVFVTALTLPALENAQAAVHYVNPNSPTPAAPFASWGTAATNIQAAIDAASPGDDILVTNGVYATGGRAVFATMTNRVVVDKAVTVRSVNGPLFTIIKGFQVPLTTNGVSAIRCVYLADGALLSGFTLTNGATQSISDIGNAQSGGGVWCNSTAAIVSNCVIAGNSAVWDGGGAESGTLMNCVLAANSAREGGGAWSATLIGCTLSNNVGYAGSTGGGAFFGSLSNCVLVANSAGYGGGCYSATLINCLLTGNSASFGGGAYLGKLVNCTVVGNSVTGSINNTGGGTYGSILTNSIVYFNTAPAGANYDTNNNSMTYCCALPLPPGPGNTASDPLFVDRAGGNLRLQSNSPCINIGLNAAVTATADLDGRPRIAQSVVDMGAYEFQPGVSGSFIGWLAQYGLPTDGSADYADSDADGMNNWQEWRCGTIPTSALSVLRMLAPARSGANVNISWQSVPGISYFLQRSTQLGSPASFAPLATNLTSSTGTAAYTDTNAASAPRLYYRIGVGN